MGDVRSRNIILEGSRIPIYALAEVRLNFWGYARLRSVETAGVFSTTWRSAKSIKPGRAVSLLRMEVSDRGLRPSASPHAFATGRGGGHGPVPGRGH